MAAATAASAERTAPAVMRADCSSRADSGSARQRCKSARPIALRLALPAKHFARNKRPCNSPSRSKLHACRWLDLKLQRARSPGPSKRSIACPRQRRPL
eukprot:7205116-Prymnesium_polylepis.1